MFNKLTVLDITDLPGNIKDAAYAAFQDQINGNDSYIKVWPIEVMEFDEDDMNTGEIRSYEDFAENMYRDPNMYAFYKWCVEQGQTEEFILLYWW